MIARTHAGAAAHGDEAAVTVTNAAFAWDPLRKPLLAALNFTLPAGSCAVVIGEVGCGKSSLLAALLGEMPRVRGTATLRGAVAYTAQDPWIQNATVEANILMGTPMDEERYAAVLHACALQADLTSLPAGDQTEIGEKGVNLSGASRVHSHSTDHVRSWPRCWSLVRVPYSRTLLLSCVSGDCLTGGCVSYDRGVGAAPFVSGQHSELGVSVSEGARFVGNELQSIGLYSCSAVSALLLLPESRRFCGYSIALCTPGCAPHGKVGGCTLAHVFVAHPPPPCRER